MCKRSKYKILTSRITRENISQEKYITSLLLYRFSIIQAFGRTLDGWNPTGVPHKNNENTQVKFFQVNVNTLKQNRAIPSTSETFQVARKLY